MQAGEVSRLLENTDDWFGSFYYDVLYEERDETEARLFLDKLLHHLQPPADATMLDVACGKGRHARYLAEQGYLVVGLDISDANIRVAKQFEHDRLHFYRHDMRCVFRARFFDYVFNFFTSFGYFEHETDNIITLRSFAEALKTGGTVVIDFLNPQPLFQQLPMHEQKMKRGIFFDIYKYFQDGYIYKRITVKEKNIIQTYLERVQAIDLSMFEHYFQQAGLAIEEVFGDYLLQPFDRYRSDRMIIVGKKML